jgi:hypothetical protein
MHVFSSMFIIISEGNDMDHSFCKMAIKWVESGSISVTPCIQVCHRLRKDVLVHRGF